MSEPRKESAPQSGQDGERERLLKQAADGELRRRQDTEPQSEQHDSVNQSTTEELRAVAAATRSAPPAATLGQTPLPQAGSDDLQPGVETKGPPANQQAGTKKEELRSTPGEAAKPTLPIFKVAETCVSPEHGTNILDLRDEAREGATEPESHTTGVVVPPGQHATMLAVPLASTCAPYEHGIDKEQSKALAAASTPDVPLPFSSTPLSGLPNKSHPSLFPATPTAFNVSPLLTPASGIGPSPSAYFPTESSSMNPTPSGAPLSRGLGSGATAAPVNGALAEMPSSVVPSKVDLSTAIGPDGKQSQPGKFFSASDTAWSKRKLTVRFGTTTIREFTQGSISYIDAHPLLCSLVCGLMLFSSTIVAMLVILLTQRNATMTVDYCSSSECARATAWLHSLMDDAVEPCHDFHTHVCRRWEALVGLSYVGGNMHELAMRVSRSLLNANTISVLPRNTRLVAAFHRVCHSFMLEPGGQALRVEMMRSLVGFLGDLLTLDRYPDVLVRLVNLSLAQGVHTLFGVKLLYRGEVHYVSLFPGTPLAQKVQPSTKAPFDQYLPLLVAAAVSTGRSLDVKMVVHIEEQVQRILAINDGGGTLQQELKATHLPTLSEALDARGWLAALNAHLPTGKKLGYDSSVWVDGLASVKSILKLFAILPNHGVAYVYFNALLDGFRFDYLRTVPDKLDVDVVLTCLQASAEAMWHTRSVVADAIFGNRTSEAGSGVTKDVLHWVRLSLSHSHGDLGWMGGTLRRHTNRTLSTLKLHLHDKSDWNATYLDFSREAQELLAVKRPVEFPAMYIRLRAEQQQSFLSNPTSKGDTDKLHSFDEAPTYDDTSNALIVPGCLRVEPLLYSRDVPYEFTAGTLGVLVARELYRAVLLSNTSGFWSTREEKALARFQDCVRTLSLTIFNVSLATGECDERGPLNEKGVHLTWMMAARTAHEGLRMSLQGFWNASNWARYWKRAQRTFFRRFCLLTCGGKRGDAVISETVPPKLLCLLSVANIPEFAEAFDCPAVVNPDTVCALE